VASPRAIVTGRDKQPSEISMVLSGNRDQIPTTDPSQVSQAYWEDAFGPAQMPAPPSEPSKMREIAESLGGQVRDWWSGITEPWEAAKSLASDLTPQWASDLGAKAKSAVASAFTPTPEAEQVRDILHQQIEAQRPHFDNPVLDVAMNPMSAVQRLGTDALIDSTTPGGAALNFVPELAMMPFLGGELGPLVKRIFPKVDAYGKPAGFLSGKTILKRAEAVGETLTPELRNALKQLAEQVGERRVAPAELHAIAAGEAYKPERVIRKVKQLKEGEKQIAGAPLGVTGARQERALRERYLQGVERGVAGRDWYDEAGKAILFHANDDPARARLVAGDLAITSPTSTVGANTGFGIKGYNQATAGVPVEAGRFPTAMGKNIEALHEGGTRATGLKRDPFATNIERGGGFVDPTDPDIPSRAVHDIWDAEGWGYVNPDGSPMRTGFGPAQHRWMDTQQDKVIAAANERALGGFTDWNELKTQAAQWVAQKVKAGDIKPEDAAKHYGDYLAQLYAQGSRETIPGETTGHMRELLEPGSDRYRALLHEMMTGRSGIYDEQLRDQIVAGYGGLTGRAFEGPGVFKGEISPGMQTQVLTGSLEAPEGPFGKRILDEGSKRILDASEATHGLLMGQDASAYSRILPAGVGVPRTGWDVALPGGTITPDQMQTLVRQLGSRVGDMALVPTPSGIRLGFMDEKTARQIIKSLGGKVERAGSFEGNYLPNDWRVNRVGQGYFDAIRKMGTEKFDRFAPGIAARLRDIDARFLKETGGRVTLSPILGEVRAAIASDGFAGLERMAKKYGIPVALLVASLGALQEPGPVSDQPSAQQ